MLRIISDPLCEIHALCLRHGVRRLELFGSAAHGDFDPLHSDLDFFVEVHDAGWQGSFNRSMGLKLGLEDMLGLSVDLIEPDAVTNPHFMSVAGKYRQPVYAA